MRTPFALLEPYIRLSPRAVRAAATFALLASIAIIVTGGVVRLTGSGLGCPTWPRCTSNSVIPPADIGINGIIEFTNRMLTTVISVAVGLVIITARFQRVPNRWLVRTGWAQFWIVVLNAVLGGLTVLFDLNPYMVAAHFLAATLLLTTTTLSYDFVYSHAFEVWNRRTLSGSGSRYAEARAQGGSTAVPEPPAEDPTRPTRTRLAWILLVVAGLLVTAGTLVTGAGPHPGDSSDVPRIRIDWAGLTWFHAIVGTSVLVLAIVCALSAHRAGDRKTFHRSLLLTGLLLAQMAVGTYQSLDGLPRAAVAVHMFGAALVWVGVLRVLLATIHPDPATPLVPPQTDDASAHIANAQVTQHSLQ